MGDQCLEHTGCVNRISTLEKELSKLDVVQDDHGRRIGELETEGRVERASLTRTDRLLVIVIPSLVTLAGILWQHFSVAETIAGGR